MTMTVPLKTQRVTTNDKHANIPYKVKICDLVQLVLVPLYVLLQGIGSRSNDEEGHGYFQGWHIGEILPIY